MSTQVVVFFITFMFAILQDNGTYSFKTLADLKARLSKVENEEFTPTDEWVGKAMNFINSNKTMLGLIAGELWNVGSKAMDKIVDAHARMIDDKARMKLEMQKKEEMERARENDTIIYM